jgi:hypothetical protein
MGQIDAVRTQHIAIDGAAHAALALGAKIHIPTGLRRHIRLRRKLLIGECLRRSLRRRSGLGHGRLGLLPGSCRRRGLASARKRDISQISKHRASAAMAIRVSTTLMPQSYRKPM